MSVGIDPESMQIWQWTSRFSVLIFLQMSADQKRSGVQERQNKIKNPAVHCAAGVASLAFERWFARYRPTGVHKTCCTNISRINTNSRCHYFASIKYHLTIIQNFKIPSRSNPTDLVRLAFHAGCSLWCVKKVAPEPKSLTNLRARISSVLNN